jgi:hypothetical protein
MAPLAAHFQLDGGRLPGQTSRLFCPAAHEQLWTPWLSSPSRKRPEPLNPTQPRFSTHALGWDVDDYRGAKIVWHGGAVFGFLTAVVLIPDRHAGKKALRLTGRVRGGGHHCECNRRKTRAGEAFAVGFSVGS